jgi:transcription-repair coupling factor (superfamily II helicase)
MKLRESQVLRLQRLYPGTIVKQTVDTVLVPRPKTARIGGTPLRDTDLLTWATTLLDAVLGDSIGARAAAGAGTTT